MPPATERSTDVVLLAVALNAPVSPVAASDAVADVKALPEKAPVFPVAPSTAVVVLLAVPLNVPAAPVAASAAEMAAFAVPLNAPLSPVAAKAASACVVNDELACGVPLLLLVEPSSTMAQIL